MRCSRNSSAPLRRSAAWSAWPRPFAAAARAVSPSQRCRCLRRRCCPSRSGPFRAFRPDVMVRLRATTALDAVNQVAGYRADIGLILGTSGDARVETTLLCQSEIGCALPPRHPLAARRTLSFADIRGRYPDLAEPAATRWCALPRHAARRRGGPHSHRGIAIQRGVRPGARRSRYRGAGRLRSGGGKGAGPGDALAEAPHSASGNNSSLSYARAIAAGHGISRGPREGVRQLRFFNRLRRRPAQIAPVRLHSVTSVMCGCPLRVKVDELRRLESTGAVMCPASDAAGLATGPDELRGVECH